MAKKILTQAAYAVDNVQQLPTQVKGQASLLKQTFDKTGTDQKTYNNTTLLTELQSETLNDSGAHAIGLNVAEITAKNVADGMKENRQAINDVVLGQIPDNSLTEAKMAAEMKKQPGGVLPYNVVGDSFYSRLLEWYGNTKIADDGQDVSEWTSVTGTLTQDTTNVKIGNGSIRITENDNIAGGIEAHKNGIALDFSKFENGEVSDDNDYVNITFYISDVSKVGALGVIVSLSQDTPHTGINRKQIVINTGLVTGWNYKRIRKGDFNTDGGGAWDGIQSIAIYWESLVNSQNEYVSFQSIQLVKKDPTLAIPNPFQRNGVADFNINNGYWFIGLEYGINTVKELTGISDVDAISSVKTYSNNYTATLISRNDNNLRSSRLTIVDENDVANRIGFYVDSDTLTLRTVISNSVSVVDTKPLNVSANDTVSLTLEKNGDTITGYASINNKEKIIISIKDTFNYTVKLAYGIPSTALSNLISISITQIPHAHHADIAEVANRTNAIRIDKTELTIPNTGWVASGSVRYPQKLDFDISGVLETDDVTLVPVLDDSDIAKTADIAEQLIEYNGGVTIYAASVPTASIGVIPTILKR